MLFFIIFEKRKTRNYDLQQLENRKERGGILRS